MTSTELFTWLLGVPLAWGVPKFGLVCKARTSAAAARSFSQDRFCFHLKKVPLKKKRNIHIAGSCTMFTHHIQKSEKTQQPGSVTSAMMRLIFDLPCEASKDWCAGQCKLLPSDRRDLNAVASIVGLVLQIECHKMTFWFFRFSCKLYPICQGKTNSFCCRWILYQRYPKVLKINDHGSSIDWQIGLLGCLIDGSRRDPIMFLKAIIKQCQLLDVISILAICIITANSVKFV